MLICSCELTKVGTTKYCEYHKKQFARIQKQIKELEKSITDEQKSINKILNGVK